MFCRNCGNEVNENALACMKCGCDPKKGNNNCHSCGVVTNASQVVCVSCGVSLKKETFTIDTSSLEKIDTGALLKNKQLIFAVVALIGYLMPWMSTRGISISGIGIQRISEYVPGGGLMTLIFLFPLSLIGLILSNFLPQLLKYKKLLTISSIVTVFYALLSIIMYMNEYGGFDIEVIGFGYYVSLIGTIASAFFGAKND
jgi:hypothetical protein